MRIPALVSVIALASLFVASYSTAPDATTAMQSDAVLSSVRSSDITSDTPILDAPVTAETVDVAANSPPNRREKFNRVLVTGGAGFIGSHLVDRLMDEGNMVIVVDNLFTGKKSNLQRHFGNPRFEFLRQDVTEPLNGIEVDQIYHLACPASPIHYKYNSVKTLKVGCGWLQVSFFFASQNAYLAAD